MYRGQSLCILRHKIAVIMRCILVLSVLSHTLCPFVLGCTVSSFQPYANIVLLAGNSINNGGASVIQGSLAADKINGFPPGTSTGTLYVKDSNYDTAVAQYDSVINCITSSYTTSTSIADNTWKNGLALTPGNYSLNNPSLSTGNVTLDAQGDANAVWVFQVAQNFALSGTANIQIVNGGNPSNVYFVIQHGLNFGAGGPHLVVGNYFALQAVTFSNSVLTGALYSQGGSIAMTTSTVILAVDVQPPTFEFCPTNQNLNTNPTVCVAVCTYGTPTATDSDGSAPNITLTSGLSSGQSFPLGVTNVVYTAKDLAGNSANCSFNVTVQDTQSPSITCPSNINQNTDSGRNTSLVSYTISYSDNCPNSQLSMLNGLQSGSNFPIGISNVTYAVTDASGNSNTCSFHVTIIDNENPTFIVCPTNITVNTNPSQCGNIVNYSTPTASDNSGATVLINRNSGFASGSFFPVGVTTVVFSATDPSSNQAYCSFNVAVLDNQHPIIACPSNIIQNTDLNQPDAAVSYNNATYGDNCPGSSIAVTNGPVSGSHFSIGVTTVTFTVTDSSSLQSSCSFNVTVIDAQNPSFINCPTNINSSTDVNQCAAVISYSNQIAIDNSGSVIVVRITGLASGSAFPVGITTVTYRASDPSLNTADCTFNVTVTDIQSPTITCPFNITQNVDINQPGAVVSYNNATYSDNCPGSNLAVPNGPVTGSHFSIGVTTVTFTVTDSSSLQASCSLNVTVIDIQSPSFTTCPSSINVNSDLNQCSAVIFYPNPTASDNSGTVMVTRISGLSSGSAFSVGITTVTYRASDPSLNTADCTFTVTVTDDQPPTITCPSNIFQNTDINQPNALVSYNNATYGDNCPGSIISITNGPVSHSYFSIGVTPVTFTVMDANLLQASCTFNVTVVDAQNPLFTTCPNNTSVNTNPNQCSSIVSFTTPNAIDNSGTVSVTRIAGLAPGSAFPIGVTTVSYRASDPSVNEADCSFNVTVTDNQPPTITCPSNIIQNTDIDQPDAIISYNNATYADNCPGSNISVTNGPPSGSHFGIGVTPVIFTVTDASSLQTACIFNVTVIDTQTPSFTSCLSNINANSDINQCSSIVSYSNPIAIDNSGSVLVNRIVGLASGSAFPVGVTTVTYRALDPSLNKADCTFTVTVTDNQPPIITCPSYITQNTDADQPYATVSFNNATYVDNCPGSSVAVSNGPLSGSLFNIGATIVTFTVTDGSSLQTSCSFNVTVIDAQNPSFTSCPSNVNVNTDLNQCSAIISYPNPIAIDNSGSVIVSRIAGLASGSAFSVGMTTVTYRASDSSGNKADCTFTVSVTDNQPPSITCPANANVDTAPGSCYTTYAYSPPTAYDNCPQNLVVILVAGYASGESFRKGSNLITYQAQDGVFTASCNFAVIVEDHEQPTIWSCPSNMIVNTTIGQCSAVATFSNPSFGDNCPGVTLQRVGPSSGSVFNLGAASVTFSVIDASGFANSASCNSMIVNVIDNQPPSIECPPDIIQNVDFQQSGAIVVYSTPIFGDNCAGANIEMTNGIASGSLFPIGSTIVTYRATDVAGLENICSFNVTIVDSTNPVYTYCPSNIVVDTDVDECNAVVNYANPIAFDNGVELVTELISGLSPLSVFPLGSTLVTYLTTDLSSNVAYCIFTVTVVDKQPPNLNCPSSISANNDPGTCGAIVNYTAPNFSDNCGNAGVSLNLIRGLTTGQFFPVQSNVITFQASDMAGNTNSCSFLVNVNDVEDPIVNCPSNFNANTRNDYCNVSVTYPTPVGSDNCGPPIVSIVTGLAAGSTFPLGINTVSWQAIDASSRTSQCSFNVTVLDNQPPTITCPVNANINTAPGQCNTTYFYSLPTVYDNCPQNLVLSLVTGYLSGSSFPKGSNILSYQVQDGVFTANCSFKVMVEDHENPQIGSCPSDINTNTTLGQCSAVVTFPSPTVEDNCEGSTLQRVGPNSGSMFGLGITAVIFTAVDASGFGNSASCSPMIVNVTDNQAPSIVCPPNIIQNSDFQQSGAVVTYSAPTYGDNCPGVSIAMTSGIATGMMFPIGSTIVSYTATDVARLHNSCSFKVTIIDNQKPIFSSCPGDINSVALDGVCFAKVDYVVPSASDNSGFVSVILVAGYDTGSDFPVGGTVVTYQATDPSSNYKDCTFTVTVADTQRPTINCPVNIVTTTASGMGNAVVDYMTNITYADNCPGSVISLLSGIGSGESFPIGSSTISYEAMDSSGLSSICTFNITVIDDESPSFTSCPNNMSMNTTANQCSHVISFPIPAAVDNSGSSNVVLINGLAAGSAFPVGVTTVTYRAADPSLNTADCTFTVTITDNQLPAISCPANIIQNTDLNQSNALVSFSNATYSDNCPGSTVAVTNGATSGSHFTIGINFVVFTVTDASSLQASCGFNVTIIDAQNPTFTNCPTNINANSDINQCSAVIVYSNPTSFDNSGSVIVNLIAGLASGSTFPVGTTTVTYRASDPSLNKADCTFTVTITDNQSPSITCPSNIIQNTDSNQPNAVVSYNHAPYSDNCPGSNIAVTNGPVSGSHFSIGVTTVTFTVTDRSSLQSSCTFNVTVVDLQNPSFTTCPNNINVNTNVNQCSAVISYPNPTAIDNSGSVSVNRIAGLASGSAFPIGLTTVIYRASDPSLNKNDCTFTVIVTDNQPPSITCPSNFIQNTDINQPTALISYSSAIYGDNCPGSSLAVTSGPVSGSHFSIGVTTVTFTATDASSLQSSCSFNVTIIDAQNPSFTNCPNNINANTDLNQCSAVIFYSNPTSIDNSGSVIVNMIAGLASGSTFPLGTTAVTYRATDPSANKENCTFTVTVTDNQLPIITCPSNTSINTSPGLCSTAYTYSPPITYDNCPQNLVVSLVAGYTSGANFSVGSNIITYQAQDGIFTTSCNFEVNVLDNEAPSILCPPGIIVGTSRDSCSTLVTYSSPVINDNCGSTTVLQITGLSSNSLFPAGNTSNLYLAEDSSGNKNTCAFQVSVIDSQPPLLIYCPTSQVYPNSPGICGSTVNFSQPIFWDNCSGNLTLTQSMGIISGSMFPIGTTDQEITATDSSGNSEVCSFNVTVNDITPYGCDICGTVVCQALDQCHAVGVCDPLFGNCTNPVVSDGTSCDDANPCTNSDKCMAGECSGFPFCLEDGNPCTDTCVNGQCNVPNNINICDDADLCTRNDRCLNGLCTGEVICSDDGNPCTDTCVNGLCNVANNGNPCDDGNPCTTIDKCVAGFCMGTATCVDDSNPCTATCLEGNCNIIINGPCDDGEVCTINDQCSNGVCMGEWNNTDTDGDGIIDCQDNCVNFLNPDQSDIDGDNIGDICDPDFVMAPVPTWTNIIPPISTPLGLPIIPIQPTSSSPPLISTPIPNAHPFIQSSNHEIIGGSASLPILDGSGNSIGSVEIQIAGGTAQVMITPVTNVPSDRIASPAVDITLIGGQLDGNAQICLAVSSNNQRVNKDGCLGYLDESTGKWRCEDACLTTNSNGQLCGSTSHFSTFAILFGSGGSGTQGCVSVAYGIFSSQKYDIALGGGIMALVFLFWCVCIFLVLFISPFQRVFYGKDTWRIKQQRKVKRPDSVKLEKEDVETALWGDEDLDGFAVEGGEEELLSM